MTDTSADYIAKVLNAAPFADNDAGIPEMCALIRALAARVAGLEKQQHLALELELARAVPIPEGYKEQ